MQIVKSWYILWMDLNLNRPCKPGTWCWTHIGGLSCKNPLSCDEYGAKFCRGQYQYICRFRPDSGRPGPGQCGHSTGGLRRSSGRWWLAWLRLRCTEWGGSAACTLDSGYTEWTLTSDGRQLEMIACPGRTLPDTRTEDIGIEGDSVEALRIYAN